MAVKNKTWIVFFIFLIGMPLDIFALDKSFQPLVENFPQVYQKPLIEALDSSNENINELLLAAEEVEPSYREGLAFLLSNMPDRDLISLKARFLLQNVRLAYETREVMPWGKDIPDEIFLIMCCLM